MISPLKDVKQTALCPGHPHLLTFHDRTGPNLVAT